MNTKRAEELHSQKIDDQLNAEEEAELEGLMKDTDCRREVAGIGRAVELMESLPRNEAPPELAGAIQQQVREQGSPNISRPNWGIGWIAAGIAALLAIVLLASRDPVGAKNKPKLAGHEKQSSVTGSKGNGVQGNGVRTEDPTAQPGEDPDNLAAQLRGPFQVDIPNGLNVEAHPNTSPRRFDSGRLYIGPRSQFRVKEDESSSTEQKDSQSLPAPHIEILAKAGSLSGAKLQSILANAGATFTYSRTDDSFTFVAVISRSKVSDVLERIERSDSLELIQRRHIPNGKSRTPTTLVLRLDLK